MWMYIDNRMLNIDKFCCIEIEEDAIYFYLDADVSSFASHFPSEEEAQKVFEKIKEKIRMAQ